jgi:hypothetical protein
MYDKIIRLVRSMNPTRILGQRFLTIFLMYYKETLSYVYTLFKSTCFDISSGQITSYTAEVYKL